MILQPTDWLVLFAVAWTIVFVGYIAVSVVADWMSADARRISQRIRRYISER